MTPLIQYLRTGQVPPTSHAARSLRMKAAHYALHNGVLYKKGYLEPWLRCVGPNQALYVLQELHHGSCGSHAGARTLAQKAIRTGYFWPSIYRDADRLVRSCKQCQLHAPLKHLPQTELHPIHSPCPFYQWGIDIVGPFPEAPGRFRFLVVAVDYFTKWVEAAPLTTITGRNILKFVWQNIVCRFGLPRIIISDNGKQFADNPFKSWCAELHITQKFTSVYHPQANGQTEVTNRTLLSGPQNATGPRQRRLG